MAAIGKPLRRWIGRLVTGTGLCCALAPHPVCAQVATGPKREPKWTAEVYSGAALVQSSTGGAGASFPAGTTFRTEPGFPSRANPSWFFGDGAALFNEVNAQLASRFNVRFPQLVPLDGMLTSASLDREAGASLGFRVGRTLTPRLGLEFSFDLIPGRLRVEESARNAIEASRASFERAFSGLVASMPQTGLRVTSTADIAEGVKHNERAITGALALALTKRPRLATHVLVGAGRAFNRVVPLEARLTGNYQFRFIDTYPFNETDTVTIRFSDRSSSTIGVVGGGITSDFRGGHGVRADVRLFVRGSGLSTTVDASPSVQRLGPFVALPSNTNPSLQFSTTAIDRSSLNGSTAGLNTFTGSGLDMRMMLNVGYFVRF